MTVRKIYKYPHPVLRQKCAEIDVSAIVSAEMQALITDMLETMYDMPGAVGLAAPQIGEAVRLLVIDVTATGTREELKVIINPVITQQSRNKSVREGCLSFPEYLANTKRATKVTFEAYDQTGVLQTYNVRDLEAIAVQHEMDHLDGVLMIDRITSLKTDWIRRQPKPNI